MQVIHPDPVLIYLAVSFQNYFEVQLRLSNKMKRYEKSFYFLWEILFRHNPKAAVPLQSIHRVD